MILLVAALLFSIAPLTRAAEDKIGVTLDLTYASKWLTKGAQGYQSDGALFKTIDLDFYGTGFGVKTTHRNSTSSGHVDKQRFDYRPYYKGVMFDGQPYVTNYNLSVGYEHYPGLARHRSGTTWEWIFAFSWPQLLANGIVPRYTAHYEYAAGTDYTKQTGADIPSGWVHRFGLGYDIETTSLPNPLHLSSEVGYYDGLGGQVHDWAYANIGLSTSFDLGKGVRLIPAVYHQISMDKSINDDDVTYVMLSMRYKF